MTLAEVLAPYDQGEFLKETWGRRFLHIPGAADKFARLLPWATLGDVLSHRVDPSQVQLAKDGQNIEAREFIRKEAGDQFGRLMVPELIAHLRAGAVLVIDMIDEMVEPIARLAEALEFDVSERFRVNAYIGWQSSAGFDLHWDDHDVLVLQISGRKRWKVFPASRPWPLARDIEPEMTPPSHPVWDEVLTQGDMLYIPRGWWHVATAQDEPTIHLTCGVSQQTGLDLLKWTRAKMRAADIFRMDLPRFGTEDEQDRHLDALRRALLDFWTPGLLARYFTHLDATALPRTSLNLPSQIMPEKAALTDDTCIQAIFPRRITIADGSASGDVVLEAHGQRWVFGAAMAEAIRLLVRRRMCRIADLQAASPALEAGRLTLLIRELVVAGLVIVREDAATR